MMQIPIDTWRTLRPKWRKCQFCKQVRECRHGPDPYLLLYLDETEMVWLCHECYVLRENAQHLPECERDL